jgi:Tfp pilus assembly protein PilN
MKRRLAEATKARRTRRTRGEMVLRFFLVVLVRVLVEAAGFFLTGVFFAAVFFDGVR